MARSPVARRPGAGLRAGGAEAARRSSFGVAVGLLIQYAVGLWVSVYVTVPARDQGGGTFAAVGRALANGPAALGLHAALGLLLLLGSIVLVVRAVVAGDRFFMVTTVVSLLAVLGAAGSGAAFVNNGSRRRVPDHGPAHRRGPALPADQPVPAQCPAPGIRPARPLTCPIPVMPCGPGGSEPPGPQATNLQPPTTQGTSQGS